MMTTVMRLGLERGWIELRQAFRSGRSLFTYGSNPIVFLLLAVVSPANTPVLISGGIAATAMLIALASLPQLLATDSADGSLLRVRGLPHGVAAYVIGKVVFMVGVTMASCAVLLAGAAIIAPAAVPHTALQWFTLLWVLVAAIAAFTPLGILIGSVLPNSREAVGLAMIPVIALLSISGVFFPLEAAPGWLQVIAEIFPLAWATAGIRAALAVDGPASWAALPALGVMVAWTLLGSALAIGAVRRSARRQSGSAPRRRLATAAS